MAKRSQYSVSIVTIFVTASFVTLLSLFVCDRFEQIQPLAYMDEEFHVRQTKTYLVGNWSVWDEKITTPPGTYALFLAYYHIFLRWLHIDQSSLTLFHFRSFNSIIAGLNFCLIYTISHRLHKDRGLQNILFSLILVSNPVLFFFSSMYYTDQCALLFVLFGVYLCMKRCHLLSAVACAFGIFVRQTNVVWLLPIFGWLVGIRISHELFGSSHLSLLQPAWCRRLWNRTKQHTSSMICLLFKSSIACYSHILVGLLFLVFVYWNGGIVMGDKKAHVAVVHIPQLWYFVTFCAICTPLRFLSFWFRALRFPIPLGKRFFHICLFIIFTTLIVFSLKYFAFIHPYLLADNRHYVFYIWRRIINHSSMTYYGLGAVYAVCGIYWFGSLFSHDPIPLPVATMRAFISVSTCLTLIPAGLLELRYFLIPYICWRLLAGTSHDSWISFSTELILNMLVHSATVYAFIYLPFQWVSSPDTPQRFMW